MAAPSRPALVDGKCPVHGVQVAENAACPACLAEAVPLPRQGDTPEEADEKHVRRAEGIDEVLEEAGPDDV